MRLPSKLLLCVATALALLASGADATAAPAPALDTSFGVGGRVASALDLPSSQWFEDVVKAAPAANGSVLLADGAHVLRHLPDGSLDPGFGSGGIAAIPVPAGARFTLAGVEETPQGGALVLGTAAFDKDPIPLPGPNSGAPIARSEAMVARFDAEGRPDASFGSGGVLLTSLGLPAALEEGRSLEAASLLVGDVAFDAEGRAVIGGAFVAALSPCRDQADATNTESFLARLTADGTPDPSFGVGGLVLDARLGAVGGVELAPGGAPLAQGTLAAGCGQGPAVFSAYTEAGAVRADFGRDGIRRLPDGTAAFSLDGRGRILLATSSGPIHIGGTGPVGEPERGYRVDVRRLLSDGRRDRSFALGGRTPAFSLPGVRSRPSAVLAAPGGRVLLAAALSTGDGRHRDGRGYYAAFGFAENGRGSSSPKALRIGFGSEASVYTPGALLDPAGRLLLFGPLSASYLPGGEGLAIAALRTGP